MFFFCGKYQNGIYIRFMDELRWIVRFYVNQPERLCHSQILMQSTGFIFFNSGFFFLVYTFVCGHGLWQYKYLDLDNTQYETCIETQSESEL